MNSEIELPLYDPKIEKKSKEPTLHNHEMADIFINSHRTELENLKLVASQHIDAIYQSSLINYRPEAKVVIFDLDGTLIHTSELGAITLRPYALELLECLCKKYELWLWSAADLSHINYVFCKIANLSTYFKKVLHREHCVKLGDDVYVKCLSAFVNINLCNVVAIDDNMVSYAHDISNFLYIDRFEGSAFDTELTVLEAILAHLFEEDDVRDMIKKVCNISVFLDYASKN